MDIEWPFVVLFLGIVGMSLATICFLVWVMVEGEDDFVVHDPNEQPTQTWKVPGG